MTLIVALLLVQAAAPQTTNREVVVTARPLSDTERTWRECMARRCPPDQEIAAALAHAENQFVAGAYNAAKGTLIRTIGHVRGREREYPVQIGAIWRAKSRIDAHLGETELVRTAAVMSHRALSSGLGPDDPRTLGQRIGVGDALLQIGRFRQAIAAYRGVAVRANRLGLKREEGHALLRVAAVWTTAASGRLRSGPAQDMARQAIARIAQTTAPELAGVREAAELLTAKLDARAGDDRSIDRLIARYRTRTMDTPVLIYAPALDEFSRAGAEVQVNGSTGATSTRSFENQWVDIGFRIMPDGAVADADVLRSSNQLDPVWVGPVLKVVQGRRYAPLKASSDALGQMRVERITFTSAYFTPINSRIRQRSGIPRIVVTDLSVDPSR